MFCKKWLFGIIASLLLVFGFKAVDNFFELSKNIEIFGAVYKTVNSDYVDEPKPGELMKVGIDAMLASLDPYTNFYSESEAVDAMIMRSGEYGGVGCQSVKRGDYIYITSVFKGLAADKAGLRVGDKVTEINGKSFFTRSMDEYSNAIKGTPNSRVNLTVERDGKPISLEISREEIKIKNIAYFGLINSETGYIRLEHFLQGAGAEVKDALISLKAKGAKQVVLDLRDNGGGLLNEAVNIVNVFVDGGQLVTYSKGRTKEANRNYLTLDPATDTKIPLVVLINNRSASASEIVSGAIQDFDRGVVIGVNSFGKGLVQNVKALVYRTQMKVTIAKYYIPSGRCIQELDYGKKGKDGKATILPDSLRKKFKTKNGRIVLDGGGVKPDIIEEAVKLSKTAQLLEKNYLVFDYATLYRNKNESIGNLNAFIISDKDFEDFVNFVKLEDFKEKSDVEKQLIALKQAAEKDNSFAPISIDVQSIQLKLKEQFIKDVLTQKIELKRLISNEIIRRYYYEESLFLNSFTQDKNILKALEIFSSPINYQSVLTVK